VHQRVRQHAREDDRYAQVKDGIEIVLLAE
jgi:hypothetical protein